MDAFIAIWCSVGGLFWLGMVLFEKDDSMANPFMGAIAVIFGPLILLFVGFAVLGESSPSTSKTSTNRYKPKNPAPAKPDKTDEELCREYSSLLTELTSIFLTDEAIKPSKGNFASVQRLGALARKNAVKPVVDKENVVKILESSLTRIQDVYGSSTTGATRKGAIKGHIEMLSGSPSKPKKKSSSTNSSPRKKRKESDVIGFNLKRTESQNQADEEPTSRPQKSNSAKGASGSANNPKKKLTVDIKY